LNGIFPTFNSLNQEFSPGSHLINNFPDCFSFHLTSCKDTNVKTAHHNELENLYKESSHNQNTILIISDMSVRSNITISVSHIQREHEIIAKTIHYAMNVSFIKAELFAIRYRICHASQIQDVSHIVIIIDAICYDLSLAEVITYAKT